MANLKWSKESGVYSSITGRWVISKSGNSWVLVDNKTEKSFKFGTLKRCRKEAESIYIEEHTNIKRKKQIYEDEEVSVITGVDAKPLDTSVKKPSIGNFTGVDSKELKKETSRYSNLTPAKVENSLHPATVKTLTGYEKPVKEDEDEGVIVNKETMLWKFTPGKERKIKTGGTNDEIQISENSPLPLQREHKLGGQDAVNGQPLLRI